MFLINTNFRQMLFNAGNIPDGKIGMMNIVNYNIYPMICDLWNTYLILETVLKRMVKILLYSVWFYFRMQNKNLYVKMYKFIARMTR